VPPLARKLRYGVGGGWVELAVAEPALVEPLRILFSPYEARGSTASPPTARVAVEGGGGAYQVTDASGRTIACASLAELLSACEFALTEALLASCAGLTPLHAAGATVRGAAVLALGRAGAGKSSLAVSWQLDGHPGLGDDIVLIDDTARAHPFKRLYEIRAENLQQLGLDPDRTTLWEPGSTEAWYDPADGAGWADAVPVAVVAAVRYESGAPLAIRELNGAQALNLLLHSQLSTVTDRGANLNALVRVARQAAAYEVTFGNGRAAAAALAARVP
jgi:hypothetical protein